MDEQLRLTVTEIQRFCMHDGPGVRTTVFLKGCPLRCAWCHNPETQNGQSELLFYEKKCIGCALCVGVCPQGVHIVDSSAHTLRRSECIACGLCAEHCPTNAIQLGGTPYSVESLVSEIKKDIAFYGECGGVTLSGGEPLMQGTKTVALLKACKAAGISTAVETCGYVPKETVVSAIPYTDLFLWDLKDTDPVRHKVYTGKSNGRILENLICADGMGAKIRLRCILVHGVNTDDAHYRRIAEIAASLSHCEGVEFIPYHAYGGAKSVFIGREDNGKTEWIPSFDEIEDARRVLTSCGIRVV